MDLLGKKYPDKDDSDANWTFVKCIQQTETECGFRVVLHLYIACFCNNIEQFKEKMDSLKNAQNLNTEVRIWVSTMLQPHDQYTHRDPTWLQQIVASNV